MITMEPVVKHGRTVWDRGLLPEDEYGERLRDARGVMEEHGLDALVVVGHAADHGNLSYLTGLVPKMGWTAAVVGREREPVLLSMSGPRELPFLRPLTWLDDVRASRDLFSGAASGLVGVIGEHVENGRPVGLVGARDGLDHGAYRDLLAALDGYELREDDRLLAGLRERKRPRERVALARAHALARAAVEAAGRTFAEGNANADAALTAEHAARMGGAGDVRVLANVDADDLAPREGSSRARTEPLALYCAVELCGYWGEAVFPTGSAAERAVAAMVAAATAGAPVAALAAAATAELPGAQDDVALAYGLGGGIGLSPAETPMVRPGGEASLRDGAVLALRAITSEQGVPACAARTVAVGSHGAIPL